MGYFWDFVLYKIEEISSVSEKEYIKIITSFTLLGVERFDCSVCQMQEPNRLKITKKSMGCKEELEKPFFEIRYGNNVVKYSRCPANFKLNNWFYLFETYRAMRKNRVNPYGGEFVNIPNKLYEIFSIIYSITEEKRIKDEKKWQMKSKQK